MKINKWVVTAFSCTFLCAVIWLACVISWSLDPKNCYETDGLDKEEIPPILLSSPVFGNSVRITKKDDLNSKELLHFLDDEEMILDALTRGGFEWVEMRYEGTQGWAMFARIPYHLGKFSEIYSVPNSVFGTVVIKYSLKNRPHNACASFDRFIREAYGIQKDQFSRLDGRCIAVELATASAPYEIVLSETIRYEAKPLWVAPTQVLYSRSRFFHYWTNIQIRDAHSGRTIANHYESTFSRAGGSMGGAGGFKVGCYNQAAKYHILTSTIFSNTKQPFIAKDPKVQRHYKSGYSKRS